MSRSFTLLDPRVPLRRGKFATYWTTHGGLTLHMYWCRYVQINAAAEPRPKMEGHSTPDVLASVPRHRRCGNCLPDGD